MLLLTTMMRSSLPALCDAIAASIHAQELIRDGFGDDVTFAFDLDRLSVVPRLRDGWIEGA